MKKSISKHTFVKNAVVLLLAALMICSSGVALANTNNQEVNKKPSTTPSRSLVWDNVLGVYGSRGGIIVSTVRTEGIAFPADDFQLGTAQEVTGIAWQGGYFQCQLAQGQKDYHWDWRVLFWNDIGNGSWPGTEIYNQTISDASITRSFWFNYTRPDNGNTYWVANYSCQLPVPITFNANTKYWITIQTIQTPNAYPQGCWCRHNSSQSPIILHEAMFKGVYWGYSNWVTLMAVLIAGADPNPLPHDLNFQLLGGVPQDTTPPVTTCTLSGDMQGGVYTSDVTATLTATDDMSGVNYTMYKVDDGAWTLYTVPFVVSGNGDHVISFYSVDNAGNIETTKTTAFTIHYPILITLAGGLGIKATIKNNGTSPMVNISWSIELSGGVIIVGKTKTGIIPSLGAGNETTVKDIVFGIGKPTITVTAGGTQVVKTGTVILVFVLGL